MSFIRTALAVSAVLILGSVLPSSSFAAGNWETVPSVGSPTARHEAALAGFEDKLYLIGGRRINPVDVYDPATKRWAAQSPTPVEMHHFQAVTLGDHIYLIGAMTGPYPSEKPLEQVIAYHPKTDKFEMMHAIPADRRRGGAGAAVYKGKIYLVGGITNGHISGFQPWFDEYDPKTGVFKKLPDAPHARDHFQAVVIGDRLYAAGGRTTSQATKQVFNLTVETIDVFDFKSGQWLPSSKCPKVPTPRAGNMAVSIGGKLVIAGGESEQRVAHNEVEVYDPQSGKWSTWPTLNRGRHGTGLVQLDKYVYTASGCGNRGGSPELDSVERLAVPIARSAMPIADRDLVFAEKDGLVAVEAEHFFEQSKFETRAFHLTSSEDTPGLLPDGDPSHVAGASGGAYLEILPDTRRTHGDKLIRGTNFSPTAGKMAVLSYKVNFSTPGRYYVWVRAHSTGSEDNGLHVGIDGTWPASGQRLQWCEGKRTWRWDSKQRTEDQHCGEPHKIFLDIKERGPHTIHFSMREDGFEFDKWIMTTKRNFARPDGVGPDSFVQAGKRPKPFQFVAAPQQEAIVKAKNAAKAFVMPAAMFSESEKPGYYLDQGKWLAVNPEKNKEGKVGRTFPYPTGVYNLTLRAVGESDGQSTYQVKVDDTAIGDFKAPLSTKMFEEGSSFNRTWKNIKITEGAIIHVTSQIGSKDGQEYSRARWAAVNFEPADEATRKVAAPILAKQSTPTLAATNKRPDTSPTKPVSDKPLFQPRKPHGSGSVEITGEPKLWHKVTLTLDGPFAHEQDNAPNPFTDYRMLVTFTHESGKNLVVPGYFAADGNAKNSSAESGTKWRAHFAADTTGNWKYTVSFRQGKNAALNMDMAAKALAPFDGKSGSIKIAASDKSAPDLRAHGRLQYVGKRYLRFAGSGQYFLKVGADAPETLLAYADFDNTIAGNPKKAPIKKWAPHLGDWQTGDPTWKGGKGKGLIGAINYLSGKGCNAFSFLTYNAGGDGDNVWPFIDRDDKLHYDCSKLDQWATVFEHGTQKGMYLHFKMQETENDDHNKGKGKSAFVPECLDGGNLGLQRKLYCRELIARFGHNLALNWNLGEENTQTNAQQQAMVNYIGSLDAYDHNIVVHTYPGEQDKVYNPLLGSKSKLTGVSLQNSSLKTTHAQTVKWVEASTKAGKPWIVAFDESGSAAHAQCPDLGYKGFDGRDRSGKMIYTQHEVRKQTLWGQLMGGGAGCEYYFGYQFAENDIVCEDWRSRDQSWDYCRIAIQFFHQNKIPFWEMDCRDELVGNSDHGISKFCFAKSNDTYLVYLPNGGESKLDLGKAGGTFNVHWFNPREGGQLVTSNVKSVDGGSDVSLGNPPADKKEDWLVVLRAN